MRLSLQSDYSLRLLMHLAAHPDRLVTVGEVADRFRISQNHLMKVAFLLGREGLIQTVRGRAGGLRLASRPESIGVGDVVRRMESEIPLVECFSAEPGRCLEGAYRAERRQPGRQIIHQLALSREREIQFVCISVQQHP